MEKNSAKIRLGTAVCLFVIILLIAALVGMYLYYNKIDVNTIIKSDSNSEKVAIEQNELNRFSNFDLIYKSLINTEYNNIKSFITSDNKIKNIDVSEITIYTEDYLNAIGSKLSEEPDENIIMGACVFTVEFESIEGLALAGSPGGIHKISGNCLTDEKYFIFDKTTKKVELCTSIYLEEIQSKPNINEQIDDKNTIDNDEVEFSKDEIKRTLQNYLDLVGTRAGSSLGMLVKLGLCNYGDYDNANKTQDNYVKTNIKYSDYKEEMLEYVTEDWFNTSFKNGYKEQDGMLYYFDGGATGMEFEVKDIAIKGIYSTQAYIAQVYNVHLDGSKELENVEFHIENNNGNCVISYCD